MGVHKYRSGYIRVVSFVKENEHIGLVNKYYSNMCVEKPRLYALFRHPNIVKRFCIYGAGLRSAIYRFRFQGITCGCRIVCIRYA